jgi:hypothetical protein
MLAKVFLTFSKVSLPKAIYIPLIPEVSAGRIVIKEKNVYFNFSQLERLGFCQVSSNVFKAFIARLKSKMALVPSTSISDQL